MKAAVSTIALVLGLGVALTTPAGAQQQSQQQMQQAPADRAPQAGATGRSDSADDPDRVPENAEVGREGPAGRQRTAATEGTSTAPQRAPDVQADLIVGKSVVNARGNNIGDIEDLVVDANDNIYAVVSVGGFLGMGDKQVAIPVDRLRVGEENVVLMSQASEEELKSMPAYEQGSFRPYSE